MRPALLCVLIICLTCPVSADEPSAFPDVLPETKPLELKEPLHEVMVQGLNQYALEATKQAAKDRESHWQRDYSSLPNYTKSIAPQREEFARIIGAVDPRADLAKDEYLTFWVVLPGTSDTDAIGFAEFTGGISVPARWPVLEGINAEGLLICPANLNKDNVKGFIIALPDADWTPEDFCGLGEKYPVPKSAQLALRLAKQGYLVLVPTMISRDSKYSGHPDVAYTNQPHREFLYRMSFEMGRHVIGYEVQKVQAAVDQFEEINRRWSTTLPIGVVGVGEGGLIALYSAAVDERIQSAWVAGYFQNRDGLWEEPIYRNVWSLLTKFGDAEIASLVAPRNLVIEACAAPEIAGPPAPKEGQRGGAAPGRIVTPALESVQSEAEKARGHYVKLQREQNFNAYVTEGGKGPAGNNEALTAFLKGLNDSSELKPLQADPIPNPRPVNAEARQERQLKELVNFTQNLMQNSANYRYKVWGNADRSTVEKWQASTKALKEQVWQEMFGKLPEPGNELNLRSRKILDEKEYVGYEVLMDVYPGSPIIAGGILLLPRDLKAGEKRPLVVCQHGLEGTPMDTITAVPGNAYGAYKSFSAQLVKRGFIVYAPQNPYIGLDKFRTIQRKSNPLKLSLFAYIIRQHQQTLNWLKTLPSVDPSRIAFYGLSYGGKTAVRVPPMLDDYCLSICSADFNEWIRKNVSNTDRYSYIFTIEYEMFEWNMGHLANYAELSNLMTPRPFMVERGHNDGVAPDEWVAWEYAKVRRHYDQIGLGDKTEMEVFNGPHTINGQATFAFLHRHLNWPAPAK